MGIARTCLLKIQIQRVDILVNPNTKPINTKPNDGPIDNAMLAFSISLGSVVISIFLPIFLMIVGISLLWLIWIMSRVNRVCELQRILIQEQTESCEQAIATAALLRALIDAADIPVLATDEHGCISLTNRRAQEMLGIGEAMIGRRFDEIMPHEVLHQLESQARANKPGHARLALPIAGEMREFDVSADPVEYSQGSVLTFRDITELSRAMTLKADFAANASHELRTPIASIKGAAETLAGPARSDEQMSGRLIEMIANNAVRLEMLTADLLDLSRLEAEDQPAQIETVVLIDLIEKAFREFRSQAHRRTLTLSPEVEDGLTEIKTDISLLGLILRNLIGNAIKFAHEGTTVRVVVRCQSVGVDRTAPVPIDLDGAMGVVINVIDKGIGIPLIHQQRIFERFYQVDQARSGSGAKRGTGLGLAIVKHAAKRLGGAISLESVHQVGTTMSVELPRCCESKPDSGDSRSSISGE